MSRMAPANYSSVSMFLLLLLSTFVALSSAADQSSPPPRPQSFAFPIRKDDSTNQYYTAIHVGSNMTTFNVVIDLGGKFMWFNSIDYFNAASTYRPILCGTRECKIANGIGCVFCFLSPPVPGCTNNTCSDYALNPFTGTQGYSGLGQDTLHIYSTGNNKIQYTVRNFPFQFSDPVLREGLTGLAAGLLGLGRTRISLPAQLASAFKIPQKFALCMPSSNGVGNLVIGRGRYATPFSEISKKLVKTPLVRNPVSTDMNEVIGNFSVEYFIDVRSIRVGGKALSLNKTLLSIDKKTGAGGSGIRTVRAYTGLHRSIYRALVDEFVRAAESKKKIRRVAPVAPFTACFDSRTVPGSSTGPDVPVIDLVLRGDKDAFWRFYGSNSMVSVGNGVSCLAFVEGPPNLTGPTTSIVVGGYQLENYLLEFDVDNSILGFSPSLSTFGTSCSQFKAS